MTTPVIQVDDLRTYFHTEDEVVKAVEGVSLTIEPGHTLGVVGESGSGKSVTSLTIMKLLASTAVIEPGSKISFLGKDLVGMPEEQMRRIRGKEISMIFQEPMTALNPVFKVGDQVAEAILLHQDMTPADAQKRTLELFREVGIPNPEQRIDSFPHQLSGGQKQRVMIAMALSCNPKLLIADEPTTALDVTIQAQILEILRELRDKRGMSILFITHDLGVIAEIADDVMVMFQGKIVEYGPVLEIFTNPQHAYTKGLLACRPRLDTPYKRLPTVDDFMEVRRTRGRDGQDELEIIEKPLDEKRLAELTGSERIRRLHPKSTLPELPESVLRDADTRFVEEDEQPLLRVKDLKVHFPVRRGLFQRVVDHVKAVDGISFDVYRGQTLGLVGESGCGKTTTGRAILRLAPITSGEVSYGTLRIDQLHATKQLRKRMQIIFQDPYGSLNPRMTIESALVEPMRIHGIGSSTADRRARAVSLLEEVGLNSSHLRRYPHEFSGGQRQRICIARALTVEPDFVICDESVSALDVSVQAQVLNLLNELQERRGLTYIFISHDLSVVKFMADMMAVMNDGKIIEFGPSEAIYANPQEDYTKKLIAAAPKDDAESIRHRIQQRRAAAAARTSPGSGDRK
ncbi:MAG: ABC transporter ATP-binding protein [Planctomycetales bacterium]|nr:ABC transporter ATP-binding protein [Planctomycetales bacterium]